MAALDEEVDSLKSENSEPVEKYSDQASFESFRPSDVANAELGTSTTWLLIYTALSLYIINYIYILTAYWRIGVKGPIPLPFVGNFIAISRSGLMGSLQKWQKTYGDIHGCYIFGMTLITSDVDLARLVLVKDFSTAFWSRKEYTFKIKYLDESLIQQSGPPWKRARSYMNPAFSGAKMKQMIPLISSCCDELMIVVDKTSQDGGTFDAKTLFGPYVLDCVASCGFGIEGNCQKDPDSLVTKYAKLMTSASYSNPILFAYVCAPFLAPVINLFDVDFLPREAVDFFANVVKRSLELRSGCNSERKDFLQLMIQAAESDQNQDQSTPEDGENHEDTTVRKKVRLTAGELMGQCIVFFFAGYSTVSETISFMAYALATNPEVQIKLQKEIDEMVPEGEPISYDVVSKLEYLDKVWCEAQRCWPVGYMLKRRCTQEFTYKDCTIPKDSMIYVNVYAIHHDPKHWPQPHKFDPERFSKDAKESRHRCAFMPFGAGPRICVAMKFAILESKIALIRILQKYSFETTPDTLDLEDINNLGSMSIYPSKDLHLRLEPRN